MPAYDFSLIVAGKAEFTEEEVDALFESGCDDGTPGSSGGVASVYFTRDAPSPLEAIRSAIRDVRKAGLKVARVEIEAGALEEA